MKLDCIVVICLLVFSYTLGYPQAIYVKPAMVCLVTNVQNVKRENSNRRSEGRSAQNVPEILQQKELDLKNNLNVSISQSFSIIAKSKHF